MYRIGDDLKELVESAVATVVGTGDAEGVPHIAYAWGPRVRDDRSTIDVFVDTARSDQTIADLRANGRIAMTVADPVSYRSVQFKGVFRELGAPGAEDLDWVRHSREAFLVVVTLVGDSPTAMRNRWLDEVLRVTFEVDAAFDQTPGPRAGGPL